MRISIRTFVLMALYLAAYACMYNCIRIHAYTFSDFASANVKKYNYDSGLLVDIATGLCAP